jgi:ribosomal protein S18 acetylase RimI-like enzyme
MDRLDRRSPDLAAELDPLADAAFPAAQREELDGWVLRADPGRHRRTRAAWPRTAGTLPLAARVDALERWYADRGLPGRVQLTPASQPAGLDDLLATRGWVVDAPSGVWTAPLSDLRATTGGWDVAVADRPDPAWWTVGGADAAVLGRVTVPCAYAHCGAAAARGALDGGWLGIYEVATAPDARRRGAASAVIAALAAWGAARGAHAAYLQVEDHNAAARALYTRLGMQRSYGYRYRLAPEVSRPRGG